MALDDKPFRLEESTIEELHQAIQTGRTTCIAVVRHYIERARAYNGVASLLVTQDGAPVPEVGVRCAPARRSLSRRKPSRPRQSCPISTATKGRRSNSAAWTRPRP